MVTTLMALTDVHAGSVAEGFCSGRKLTDAASGLLDGVLKEASFRSDLQGVLCLGDLIEHAGARVPESSRAAVDQANFERVLRQFDSLRVPSLHCIGNHPVMSVAEQALADTLGLDRPYYARDIGDHRVIMLHSRFSHKGDSAEHKSGSGIFIDQEQIRWLRNELERTDRHVLVCCHHPLSEQDLRGNVWFEKYPQCALTENRDEVQELLAKSDKVVAVLNVHTHWNYLTQDKFGTPHLTLQSLSENFRNDGTPANTYGVVVLKDAAFNIEIFGNDLTLRSAEQSPQQIARDLAATYNSIAEIYDAKTFQFGAAEHSQYDSLVKRLKDSHSGRVVDFGCGPGRDVPYWSARGFEYVGVDVSQKFLDIARRRSPEQTFVAGDFASVDLPPNSAALAIHNSSLQHVPRASLDAVLRKAFETLEPGGIFYAHYRSGTGESLSISTEYGTPISRFIALYTPSEMEAALRRVGFEVLESVEFDHKYEGLKGKVVQFKTRTYARKPGGN
jgi:ubiquinone/menaquinone biosynthesis C-methylase UbiE